MRKVYKSGVRDLRPKPQINYFFGQRGGGTLHHNQKKKVKKEIFSKVLCGRSPLFPGFDTNFAPLWENLF